MSRAPSSSLRKQRPRWVWGLLGFVAAWHLTIVITFVAFMTSPTSGFLVYRYADDCLIQAISPEAKAATANLQRIEIVKVNGAAIPQYGRRAQTEFARRVSLEEGASNRFELKDGNTITLPVSKPDLDLVFEQPGILFHSVALTYFLTGLLVWWRRPDDPGSTALLLFCCQAALHMGWTLPWGPLGPWLSDIRPALLPLYGPTLVYVAARFMTMRARYLDVAQRVSTVVAIALTACFLACVVMEPADPEGWIGIVRVVMGLGGVFLLLTLVVTIFACWQGTHADNPVSVQRRGRFLLLANLLAFVVPTLGILLQVSVPGADDWYPFWLDLLCLASFPLLLAYSMIRHRIIDLRIVLRESVVYGALSLTVTLLYVFVVLTLIRAASQGKADNPWIIGAVLAILVILASLAKLRVQQLVDRLVFRKRARYAQAIVDASARLAQARNLDAIAETVQESLLEAMGLARAYLIMKREGSERLNVVALGSKPDTRTGQFLPPLVVQHQDEVEPIWRTLTTREVVRAYDSHAATAVAEEAAPPQSREVGRTEASFWTHYGIEIVVPLLMGNPDSELGAETVGALVLGPKLDGQPMSSEDEALIKTLANQLAVAVDNARAFEQIRELKDGLETQVEERTKDLSAALAELREMQGQLIESEKAAMVGRLVAGIMHEVNSPLGALSSASQTIGKSVGQLESYLNETKDAAPHQARKTERVLKATQDLTGVVGESVERINAVLGSLRSFAALDEAEEQLIDVREGLDDVIPLVSGRLSEGKSIEKQYGNGTDATVRCRPARLNQLFFNLIENAINALDDDGTISICVERQNGRVNVHVKDTGRGIEASRIPGLFDIDFATKRGQRVGMRLGLPMSKRFAEEMGGKIQIESTPGVGTDVLVSLPAVDKEQSVRKQDLSSS